MYKSSPFFHFPDPNQDPSFIRLSPCTSKNRRLCPSTLYLPPMRVSTLSPRVFWSCLCRGRFFPSLRESKSRVNELTRSHVVLNRGVYNMSSSWNKSESNWTSTKNHLLHWVFPGYPSQLVLLHHPAHTPSPGVFDGLQPPVSILSSFTAFATLSTTV